MTPKEIGTVDRNSDETALRDVWYARVLAEQGYRMPPGLICLTVPQRGLVELTAGQSFCLDIRSGPLRVEIRGCRGAS